MHIVEIAMDDIVGAGLLVKSLDATLNRTFLEYFLGRKRRVYRKHDPPSSIVVVTWHLEQGAPFIGVCNVVGQCIAVGCEIIARAQYQKLLLICEAGKRGTHALADLTAPAVAADHPA